MTPAVFKENSADQAMVTRGMSKEQVAREIGFACNIINSSSQLQKTSMESRIKAVVSIVGANLTLNPLAKEIYLIPRWDKYARGMACIAEPSYTGLMKLVTDGGAVINATAQLVYENDRFEPNLATGEVTHIPVLSKAKRGELIGAYAMANLHGGTKQMEWMDIDEIYEIRATSESYKYWATLPDAPKKNDKGFNKSNYPCFWIDWEGEMIRKTVFKRLIKWLPRSGRQNEALDQAIALSNTDFNASDDAKDYALALLRSSGYDDEMKDVLQAKIESADPTEISNIIDDLKANQADPLQSGNYGQKQIHAKLDAIEGK